MKISYIHIHNFKSIRDLEISNLENALILVGKNSTGKTVVIDAICLVAGQLEPKERHFFDKNENITIEMCIFFRRGFTALSSEGNYKQL